MLCRCGGSTEGSRVWSSRGAVPCTGGGGEGRPACTGWVGSMEPAWSRGTCCPPTEGVRLEWPLSLWDVPRASQRRPVPFPCPSPLHHHQGPWEPTISDLSAGSEAEGVRTGGQAQEGSPSLWGAGSAEDYSSAPGPFHSSPGNCQSWADSTGPGPLPSAPLRPSGHPAICSLQALRSPARPPQAARGQVHTRPHVQPPQTAATQCLPCRHQPTCPGGSGSPAPPHTPPAWHRGPRVSGGGCAACGAWLEAIAAEVGGHLPFRGDKGLLLGGGKWLANLSGGEAPPPLHSGRPSRLARRRVH